MLEDPTHSGKLLPVAYGSGEYLTQIAEIDSVDVGKGGENWGIHDVPGACRPEKHHHLSLFACHIWTLLLVHPDIFSSSRSS